MKMEYFVPVKKYYYRVEASYTGSCIFDESPDVPFGKPLYIDRLGLSDELVQEFNQWNKAYSDLMPHDEDEMMQKFPHIIKFLDQQGLKLAQKLEQELAHLDAKVDYRSYIKLEYLRKHEREENPVKLVKM